MSSTPSPAPDFNVAEAPETPPSSPGGTSAPAPAPAVPVEVERVIKRILFFKSPFDQLGVRPEHPTDEARKRFRRLSLVVHPDKCQHALAAEATGALAKAIKALEAPDTRAAEAELIEHAREKVATSWRRAHKTPKIPAGATMPGTGDTIEDPWTCPEADPAYLYDVRRETYNIAVQAAERSKRAKEVATAMEKRAREEEAEQKDMWKQREERQKKWEDGRDERVAGWRQFLDKNPKKRQKLGFAPPKTKKQERAPEPPK
eukprot:m51a1_g8729 hypothetical protein (260) ;mRNA; r:7640-8871